MEDELYITIRESDFYDRLFWTYNRLGLQSNIIVAAEYSNGERTLSRTSVTAALHAVIRAQPRLRHVLIPERRGKRTHLNVGMLKDIDLQKCIEFIEEDGKGVDAQLVEDLHNKRFDWAADKPCSPSGRVIVKHKTVIFVFSHAIGDGMSGYVFHREFLAALNSLTWPVDPSTPRTVSATAKDAEAGALKLAPLLVLPKPSIIAIIWCMLFDFIVGVVYGKRRLNHDYPPSKPYHQDFTKPPPIEALVSPRVSSRRIPAAEGSRILAACHENRTTLTPLLNILYVATMALDQFPDAIMATPAVAYDLRQYLPMHQFQEGSSPKEAGVMMNAASGSQSYLLLGPLRKLFSTELVDQEAFWGYVRAYKARVTKMMRGKSHEIFLAPQLLGSTMEDMVQKVLPKIDTRHNSLVSNLGAFTPVQIENGVPGEWKIIDVQFSVSSTNGNIGPHGAPISVAGIRGGDLNIFATYEKEVMTKNQVEELLDGIIRRLYQVTNCSGTCAGSDNSWREFRK